MRRRLSVALTDAAVTKYELGSDPTSAWAILIGLENGFSSCFVQSNPRFYCFFFDFMVSPSTLCNQSSLGSLGCDLH